MSMLNRLSEKSKIKITAGIILLVCFLYVANLSIMLRDVILVSQVQCTVEIQINENDLTSKFIHITYSGEDFNNICDNSYLKNSELFSPFSPQIIVSQNQYLDGEIILCIKNVNNNKTKITVRSSDSQLGNLFCERMEN